MASDKECTASEYVINVLDADLSRSISDERDEECTWVVPIEEVCSTKNHDNFEDTKLWKQKAIISNSNKTSDELKGFIGHRSVELYYGANS